MSKFIDCCWLLCRVNYLFQQFLVVSQQSFILTCCSSASPFVQISNNKKLRKIVIVSLPISLNMCFGCSKEPSHRDGSFEYPQYMFWLRNKKNNFQICTLICRPGLLSLNLLLTYFCQFKLTAASERIKGLDHDINSGSHKQSICHN